jgi:hypothetical protein
MIVATGGNLFRGACLNVEIFYSLKEAQIVIEHGESTTTRSDRTQRSDIGTTPQTMTPFLTPLDQAAQMQ